MVNPGGLSPESIDLWLAISTTLLSLDHTVGTVDCEQILLRLYTHSRPTRCSP